MASEVSIKVTSEGFDSARKRVEGLKESARRIGEVAAGVAASGVFERIAQSAQQAFADSIRAASGLEQAIGGTEAVFGSTADVIDDFADRSADAVGLSERAFREATTLIGGQLKRMTGDVDLAAESSIELVKVGADVAATYGGTTKEAVAAFAAALRGEADPAERFNLNLKISQQNAKAVELGLAETTSEVGENARAQALLALIMEQSTDAQGQFAREADTLAGAQQRAAAAAEDLQADLGQKLTPALAAASDLAVDLISGFQQLPGPAQVVIGLLAGAAVLAPGIIAAQQAMAALGLSIRGAALAAGPAVVVLVAVGTALAEIGARSREADQRQADLETAMRRVNDAAEDQRREMAATAIQQSDVMDQARQLGIDLETLTDIFLGDAAAAERVRDQLRPMIGESDRLGTALFALNPLATDASEIFTDQANSAQDVWVWLGEVANAADKTKKEERELAGATGEATEEQKRQAEALEELASAWASGVESFGSSVGTYQELLQAAEDKERERAQTVADETEDASDSWEDHARDVKVSIDDLIAEQERQITAMENWATNLALLAAQGVDDGLIKELAEAGPESAALVQELVDVPADKREEYVENWRRTSQQGGEALTSALTAVGPALASIASEHGDSVAREIASAIASGRNLTSKQVRKLMNSVESEVEGRELLAAIDPFVSPGARRTAENILDDLASTRYSTVYVSARRGSGWSSVRNGYMALAHGGNVGAEFDGTAQGGGPRDSRVLVGEQGAEVVDLPVGSRVIPSVDQATDRNQLAGTGGGLTINLYVQGSIRSDRDLIEMIRDEMLNGGFRGALEGEAA